jgi:hypothetical protein
MEVYYAIVFDTDLGNTVPVRITRAVADLPLETVSAAAGKMIQAACFDPKYGTITAVNSLKCVKTATVPIDLGM